MTDLSSSWPDALLADLGWLRALARSLARDAALGDDLAQEACLMALRHQAQHSWRGWCATVLANLLRQHRRSERRRHGRELAAAAPESLPAADELVARAQAQRDLTARVLALAEPYRSTVLLRFYEQLSPREIALRTGVPVATVQSRLSRALRRLRGDLEAQHGQAGWLTALLPLTAPSAPASLAFTGIAMQIKTFVAAALVVGLSLGAYSWLRADAAAADESSAAAPRVPGGGSSGGGGGGGSSAGQDRAESARRREAVAAAPAAAPSVATPRTVRGRACHVDGTAAVGLALAQRGRDQELARTGAGGSFELQTTDPGLRLVALDPGLVTLCAAACDDNSAREPIVVVASALRCAGRVVDEHGRPLADAHLRYDLPAQWAAALPFALEATERATFTARSDRDGRFVFAAVAAVPGAALRAVLDGYASATAPAPASSRDDLELTLRRPAAPLSSALRGRVLTPEGGGASEARVALGLATALADARGFFELDLARAVTAEQLRAVKAGYQLGVLDCPQPGATPRGGWPDYVEIRLGPAALDLAGTVTDSAGHAVADARVWLADATWFGVLGQMPLQGEGLAAGATIPPQALESAAQLPETDGDNFNDYRMSKPPSLACWPYVVTDRDGRFKLPGLSARDYTLRVLDPATLQMTTSGPHAAGRADVRITMPAGDVFERVRGRVVHAGRPIAGARVAVRCTPFDVRARVFGGRVDLRFEYPGGNARTDADGRFELRRVPKLGCHLVVAGDGIAPRDQAIDAQTPADELTIEVDARHQVQVKLRAPVDRADHVAAVDERGEAVDLLMLAAGSTNAYSELPLRDGKTAVFSLSSRARRIVLLKAGAPVGSIELVFQPDRVTEVEG